MTKIYLIAGEASGDFIGGKLIEHLKSIRKIEFIGIGGEGMEKAGMNPSLFSMKKINLMGFTEIIPHLFSLIKLINNTVTHILKQQPDLLITIDSPGFTYRVAAKVRKHLPNLKIAHVVAPSVWAYKPKRALKYARIYNCLFALLPFEPTFFTKIGLDCRYIGHPIVEQQFYTDKVLLRKEFNIEASTRIICVTAGSRSGEILRHLPIFCESLNNIAILHPNLMVIFVLAELNHEKLMYPFLTQAKFNYIFSTERLKAFGVADLALAKSGTNTLEIAASNTPMIVTYKLNVISYLIIKSLIKIPYVSLINIIANKEILPELLQFDCNPLMISSQLECLLTDPEKCRQQLLESQEILKRLNNNLDITPSHKLAKIINEEFLI